MSVLIGGIAVVLVACESTIRKGIYEAYEVVGVEKRDILKDRVDEARDEQKEAGQTFEDALQRLKAVYGFQGGDLEAQYEAMSSSYDRANAQAHEVKDSIKQMETVAGDLFVEWQDEIGDIKTAPLRDRSRKALSQTRQRYNQMHSSLKKSEKKMDSVLDGFHDQVLYLKHNLNAQAIASLKGEATSIQDDIEQLINELNASIAQADQFVQTLP